MERAADLPCPARRRAGRTGLRRSRYEGVQSPGWPDGFFWKPDGDGPGGPDFFRREFGFPHHPGLLERALAEFRSGGLGIPWLSCFGNHEALNQGVGTATAGIAHALVGARKPVALPDGFDHDQALELFTEHPEAFMAGPACTVMADPARQPITRRDFVAAHFRPGARPAGHGGDLAALHRELAANSPLAGAGLGLAGAPHDRNVELRLRPPFPLRRLAGE